MLPKMLRYLGTRINVRYYSATKKDTQDRYVARLMPKRIWKASEQTPNFETEEKMEKISEVVQRYLKDYNKNIEILKDRNHEFELGKRHLANIMGYDPDNITQQDIDKAIEYLFPSGLFHKKSVPVMKPPSEIYPKFKTALYDKTGRPFSSFFFNRFPNYSETLNELYSHYEDLNRIEDEKIAAGIRPTNDDKFNILQHQIITQSQLEDLFIENLKDVHYERFVNHLTRLIEHPYSNLKSDYISKFAFTKKQQRIDKDLSLILIDEKGREYSEASGERKTLRCLVRVYNNGTGKFLINDKYTMNFFPYFIYREQILTPLVAAGLLNQVDVYAYFEPVDLPLNIGWSSAYSGAIRHGLSRAIVPWVNEETREILRINGLLQRDIRKKERKKPGRHKARKGRAYRKR